MFNKKKNKANALWATEMSKIYMTFAEHFPEKAGEYATKAMELKEMAARELGYKSCYDMAMANKKKR